MEYSKKERASYLFSHTLLSKRAVRSRRIQKKHFNIDLSVGDPYEAEDVAFTLRKALRDSGESNPRIEVPCDSEVEYLLQVNNKVMVYITGEDNYLGHGESSFVFGVEGFIPNGATTEEMDEFMQWLTGIFRR